MKTEIGYRPDIDGLRAVAVLAVIFFHADVPWFSGGFVGVDIFFVISGYLITGLIFREIAEQRFSLVTFYERRVRRIFPALFLVVGVALVLGYLLMFPAELNGLGGSAVATALFSSNIYFWRTTNYFTAAAEGLPLLHTWSLAVEEQYYIVFPILYIFISRFSRLYRGALLALLAGLSLAASAWGSYGHPVPTFFLAPTRAWEFLLGGIISQGVFPRLNETILRNVVSACGAVMIGWAACIATPILMFPGVAMLVPCLGAGLIIGAGISGPSIVTNILASRIFVGIGLISYSLYLWHWVLLCFAKILHFGHLSGFDIAALVALTFALSIVSWRYIEQPFRRKSRIPARRSTLFALAAVAVACTVVTGAVFHIANGLPSRLPSATLQILGTPKISQDARAMTCYDLPLAAVAKGSVCRMGADRAGPPDFVLWGDSHSWVLYQVVDRAAKERDQVGLFIGHSGCPPLLDTTVRGVAVDEPVPGPQCKEINSATATLIQTSKAKTIILAARWALYSSGYPYVGRVHYILDDGTRFTSGDDGNEAVFARGLERTLQRFADRRIVVIGPVPELHWNAETVLARSQMTGTTIDRDPSRKDFESREKFILDLFRRLQADRNIEVILPSDRLCNQTHCVTNVGRRLLYFNDNHLSKYGAEYLAPLINKIFN